jgi:hypothetical protein
MNSYKFACKILATIFLIFTIVAFFMYNVSASNHEILIILYPLGMAIFFQLCAIEEK